MTTHHEARASAARALTRVFGHEPTIGAIKHLAGIAWLETNYGDGWRGAGRGSNNMGAIQCGASWNGDRFSYVDTHPNADGSSTEYRVDFRKYATPDDGWLDLARVVYVNRGRGGVLAAADAGDTYSVSQALHSTGYYEGYGATVSQRVANHYRALSRAIALADGATAHPAPASSLPPISQRPVLSRGTRGPAVRDAQTSLGIAADGIFGPETERAVREFQSAHGLVVDGRIGPATWSELLS